ncbi:hypothetical protein AcW1_008411 [Taiwanofungus camphoratus]|nr:hypothetical protein AcW1_008411 [Antrodia cinnamomea]
MRTLIMTKASTSSMDTVLNKCRKIQLRTARSETTSVREAQAKTLAIGPRPALNHRLENLADGGVIDLALDVVIFILSDEEMNCFRSPVSFCVHLASLGQGVCRVRLCIMFVLDRRRLVCLSSHIPRCL